MKRSYRMGWMVAVCLTQLLCACATGYHAHSLTGGYYDYPAGGANRFMVGFKGNGFTDASLVTNYAHRRAGELCKERGFKGYRVLNQDLRVDTSRTPSTTYCNGSTSGSSFSATCQEQGGHTISRAGNELMIECGNE